MSVKYIEIQASLCPILSKEGKAKGGNFLSLDNSFENRYNSELMARISSRLGL